MKALLAMLSLVTLLAAHTALAERPHGGPGFAGPRPGAPPIGGLLERLIDPCRTACLDTVRNCHDTADTEALTCIQDACATEVQTAQSACADNRPSQACRNAVSALRACSQSCLPSLRSAVSACHDGLDDCLDACEGT